MILRPSYIEKIIKYLDTPFVKILVGVRRSGKSTILQMIKNEIINRGIKNDQILSFNFDSIKYINMSGEILYNEIKNIISNNNNKFYLLFDEIQEIENWEKAINSLMIDFNVDIYLTGSNSRMLSSEISTYLTGRYIQFKIFPLSFNEYLSFKEVLGTISNKYDEFITFVKLGGFPAIHLNNYLIDEVYTIVRDIYNSTIFADIVRRNQIRNIDQLERIVKFVFDNIGRTFSAASISRYLKSENRKIDSETVYNYLEKLEKAFILHRCSRYDLEGKEILKTQEKFYICDSAMKYSILGYNSNSVAAMLENIVYLELLRRDYEVFIGKLSNGEIDFVATKNGTKIYIQVSQEISSELTGKREIDHLLSINDAYPKYLILADTFAGGVIEGIKIMHIADFLLSDEF